jgi:hypothetical protein
MGALKANPRLNTFPPARVFTVKAGMPLAARPSLSKYRRCSSYKMGVLKFPAPGNLR